MLALVRKRPVAAHFLLSVLIASAVVVFGIWRAITDPSSVSAIGAMVGKIEEGAGYINVLTIAAEAVRQPILFTIFIYAMAPTLAALLIASTGAGGGLRRLLSRLKPVGPDGGGRRALFLYAGLLAVYAFGLFAYDWVAGPGVDAYWRLKSVGGSVVFGALVGLFLDEGGSLEELGWRGFEWPNLQAGMSTPLIAALLLGLLHWAWHLPREAFTVLGGFSPTHWLIGQGEFLLLCLCLSIVAVFCVNRAGGSVWPAIFVHGGSNVWSKATNDVAPSFGVLDIRMIILGIAALLIVIFARKRMGRRPDAA